MTSEEPPSKKYVTQRTFDSTDDLLDSDEEDNKEPERTRKEHIKPRDAAFWDVRVFHWPPRSPKNVVKAGYDYVKSPFLILEVVSLVVFLGLCYYLPDLLVDAHHRPIPIQTLSTGENLIDLTFDNDYHHNETIPGSLLNLLCVVFPISVFAGYGLFFGPRGDLHAAVCMFILTMASKIFVVACIKNYAGYLRPSFYNMCKFNPQTLLCDDETTSARESFPSGHAATALSSMTVLALFLLGKVRGGTQQRGVKVDRHHDDDIWTPSLPSKVLAVASASPIFLGMFIATSRVRDNWHHPADVVCGGAIGACCALFAHSLYYPSVSSFYGGIPSATVQKIVKERKGVIKPGPKIDLDLDGDIEL